MVVDAGFMLDLLGVDLLVLRISAWALGCLKWPLLCLKTLRIVMDDRVGDVLGGDDLLLLRKLQVALRGIQDRHDQPSCHHIAACHEDRDTQGLIGVRT